MGLRVDFGDLDATGNEGQTRHVLVVGIAEEVGEEEVTVLVILVGLDLEIALRRTAFAVDCLRR